MILRLKVPDETYEKFGTISPKDPRGVMELLLEKLAGVDPNKKMVVFQGEELGELQSLCGTSVDSAGSALEAIRGALVFKVGGVDVQLTAAQRKKLVTQAQAWKRPEQEFIAQQIQELLRSL